ncbi:MAG: hypothetical protein ACMUEM_05750 [Flavobacteriales bacterium AspAUS03]
MDHLDTDVNIKDDYGNIPLNLTINYDRYETAKLIINSMIKKDFSVEKSDSITRGDHDYCENCKLEINQMKEININEREFILYDFLLLEQTSKLLSTIRNETNRKKFIKRA